MEKSVELTCSFKKLVWVRLDFNWIQLVSESFRYITLIT